MSSEIESPPDTKNGSPNHEGAAETESNTNYTSVVQDSENVNVVSTNNYSVNYRVRFDNEKYCWLPLLNTDCDQIDAVPIGSVYDAGKGKYWITTQEDQLDLRKRSRVKQTSRFRFYDS